MYLLNSYGMNDVGKLKYIVWLLLLGFSIGVNAQEADENRVEVLQDTVVHSKTDIISFLAASKEHSIFLNLLKVSGVDEDFSLETSLTLFAPTNAGFEKLPKGTLENLTLPENKYKLINILNYHILVGSESSTAMSKIITKNRGKAKFQAKSGGAITVFMKQGIFAIEGNSGKGILIENPDKLQSNGIVHVIDSVLIPQ